MKLIVSQGKELNREWSLVGLYSLGYLLDDTDWVTYRMIQTGLLIEWYRLACLLKDTDWVTYWMIQTRLLIGWSRLGYLLATYKQGYFLDNTDRVTYRLHIDWLTYWLHTDWVFCWMIQTGLLIGYMDKLVILRRTHQSCLTYTKCCSTILSKIVHTCASRTIWNFSNWITYWNFNEE